MAANTESPGGTSPGDTSHSTRQPTQLSVLLAGAGTPPLDAEQARLAPIRLWDTFVLASERARMFAGDPRALFPERPIYADPRHDALARILRTLAAAFRVRLAAYDQGHAGSELLRAVAALAPVHIEGALLGYELRRGTSTEFSAATFLGSMMPDVDPLDAPDAGVLRRFVALTTRGLMIEKGARGGGAIADLGAVTLGLGVLDLVANPRSALRAARVRLAKADRIDDRGIARVRDVGQALRELLAHAVSSSTTPGSAARDLVKETTLAPEVMDHLAVALARAVYDGLAPIEEHPLVVGGAGASEQFTVAPMLVTANDDEVDPWLGLYNRIAFLPLPYLPLELTVAPADSPATRPALPLDDAAFAQLAASLRTDARAERPAPVLVADIDAAQPEGHWSRSSGSQLGAALVDRVEVATPGIQLALLFGPRGLTTHAVLDGVADAARVEAGGDEQPWHLLAPRVTDRTLVFEPLEPNDAGGLQLRRADVSRWLDADTTRIVQWDLQPGTRVIVNAASLADADPVRVGALFDLLRDIADRADPRGVLVLAGARNLAEATKLVHRVAHEGDLEQGAVPLRTGSVLLVRTDAPLVARGDAKRSADESILAELAERVAPPAIADLAARTALLPSAGRAKGRSLRLAAIPSPVDGGSVARATLARALAEPWSGVRVRRMLQAGIASSLSARAAIAAGDVATLTLAMRHELAVLASTWDASSERPSASRVADIARGVLVESVAAACSRVAWIVDDALLAALPDGDDDRPVGASAADALHGAALGVRCAGTVYAPSETPGSVPLGFVVRGGADLFVYADVHASGTPPRIAPVPQLEFTLRPSGERTAGVGLAAQIAAALHESVRRLGNDAPLRSAPRDARSTFAALLDVSVDPRLVVDGVRIAIPLRANLADADAQKLALDLATTLAEASGTNAAGEWNVQLLGPGKSPTALPLAGPLILREVATRWQRALRVLPRTFPTGARGNARYVRAPLLATAAELGIAGAVLRERGVVTTSVQGRAVMSRVSGTASENVARARELAGTIPMRTSSLEGSDLDVLERVLAVAWFLHANFCAAQPGSLQWAPPDAPEIAPIVQQHVDRAAIKVWLQKKTSRPEPVERRVIEVLEALEPRVVVQD